MDFKRLREKWFSLCRDRFDDALMNKVVTPLNMGLARFSTERGNFVHGVWQETGPDMFRFSYWEQKTSLDWLSADVSLQEVREAVHAHRSLGIELNHFCTGKHPGFKNKTGTIAKIRRPIEP